MGSVLGTDDEARTLVTRLVERENRVRQICGTASSMGDEETSIRRPKVFVQISKEPLFTIGKGALLNDVVKAAGGRSLTSDVETAYPKLSKETALTLDPEVIILSESDDNLEPNEVFRNSPAVKNGRVYKINADLLSRPGPRLVDVLEKMGEDLGCSGE
jgi:ABC-type Fe3+-hydroxamate transport system substrate-binding protein